MKKKSSVPVHKASRVNALAAMLVAVIGYVLLSPKWTVPVFAWIAPACLLYFFRYAPFKYRFLWLFLAIYTTSMVAGYEVSPLPLPIMAIINIIAALQNCIPFLVDKWASKNTRRFAATLVFPAAFVAIEFFNASRGGGVWGSMANTQYTYSWLVQLASVTGLWGITFLVYWFASVMVWALQQYKVKENFKTGITIYGFILLLVLCFGVIRYSSGNNNKLQTKVAGVTVPLYSFMEALYKDKFHKEIKVDPRISQTSPMLQQLNLALIPFIENPDTTEFKGGYRALHTIYDSLFALSKKAANQGAKIITWSEANALVLKNEEQELVIRGTAFAKDHRVYLLMGIGAILPGKLVPGRNFIENKAVMISPEGTILNDFRKNHPVPFAEHSTPGDGKIPVIKTAFGNISSSICYDADFPETMQQLSKNKTGLLLLPSSDWYAISPYHSYMAIFRGIENGSAVMRQAANGLSIATDNRGKVLAEMNFFNDGEKLTLADIPVQHVVTVYSVIGDSLAIACILFTIAAFLFLVLKKIPGKIKALPGKIRLQKADL